MCRTPQQLFDLSAGLCCRELVYDVECSLAVGVSHRGIDATLLKRKDVGQFVDFQMTSKVSWFHVDLK